MTGRRRAEGALAVGLALLVLTPAAAAHGPEAAGTGYVSSVAGTVPNVLGVQALVLGGDDRLRVANLSRKTVVVEGYAGEPFLRFGPEGVFENVRSPTTYLSAERDPRDASVPASANAKAAPRWRKVSSGTSFEWHDHRIHWTADEPPAAVRRAPHASHLIRNWRVPAEADGRRFVIAGFLGYVPPAGEEASGTTWWLFAAGIGAGLLVAVAVGVGVRRARRRTP